MISLLIICTASHFSNHKCLDVGMIVVKYEIKKKLEIAFSRFAEKVSRKKKGGVTRIKTGE